MQKSIAILFIGFLVVFAIWYVWPPKQAKSELIQFARCLRDKKIVMYGADWCPHCQNQKSKFGDAFEYVPYVECPKNPNQCLAAGVNGYPTWIFPDGKKLIGEQELNTLSEASGCTLE